jgi:soluble lytic murein transglycosylase-like protein
VNLKYGVKYLRGAWLLSDGEHDTAIKWYASGYYYEAKRRGMLVVTGLRAG